MKDLKKDHARESFKDLLGSRVEPNIQKVSPLKEKEVAVEETQLMVWIPQELMTRIKMRAIQEKRTMKEVVNQILNENI